MTTLQLANALAIDLSQFERHFPFKGRVEFPIEMRIVGMTEQLKARVVYSALPEWEHFDVRKRRLVPSCDDRASVEYILEVLAPPETPGGRRTWKSLEIELPNSMWDAILDAVDADCLRQDRERREARGIPLAN